MGQRCLFGRQQEQKRKKKSNKTKKGDRKCQVKLPCSRLLCCSPCVVGVSVPPETRPKEQQSGKLKSSVMSSSVRFSSLLLLSLSLLLLCCCCCCCSHAAAGRVRDLGYREVA